MKAELYDKVLSAMQNNTHLKGRAALCRRYEDGEWHYCCLGLTAELAGDLTVKMSITGDEFRGPPNPDYDPDDINKDFPGLTGYLVDGAYGLPLETQQELGFTNDGTFQET